MQPITIYTKMMCPYCHRAKAVLKSKGASFKEFDITMDPDKRREMLAKSGGAMTVPQIFIGETHVGGSDDLAALEARGALDAMLEGGA